MRNLEVIPSRKSGLSSPSLVEGAFVMLEVILAIALFASVATALAVALHQLSVATTSARWESVVLRRLQSDLVEAAHQPRLELGRIESKVDEFGISTVREVEEAQASNKDGFALPGIYRIRVRAKLSKGPGSAIEMVRELETYETRFDTLQAVHAKAGPAGLPRQGQKTAASDKLSQPEKAASQ